MGLPCEDDQVMLATPAAQLKSLLSITPSAQSSAMQPMTNVCSGWAECSARLRNDCLGIDHCIVVIGAFGRRAAFRARDLDG